MAPARWFWSLRLRWRIPLGLFVLLVLAAGVYVLVAWVQYRRTRSLDLLTLAPERPPVVLRCRDGGAHWDRLRQTDVWKLAERQIEGRGPLRTAIEEASGKKWEDLVRPLSEGPAAEQLTDARVRGLFGRDVLAAVEPSAPAVWPPRGILLTRIGFLEALAFPVVRFAAARRVGVPLEKQTYRGTAVHHASGLPGLPPGTRVSFALKGDILLVATDVDLVTAALDRTFRDWEPGAGETPWVLPEGAPVALGVDFDRLPPQSDAARGVREALRLVPIREALPALDAETFGRCTIGLDARGGVLSLEAALGVRKGMSPLQPVPPPAGDASSVPRSSSSSGSASPAYSLLAAAPEQTVALVLNRCPFDGYWRLFESVSLASGRDVAAGPAFRNRWRFFQNAAQKDELPALKRAGLESQLLPHLRAGPGFLMVPDEGAPANVIDPTEKLVRKLVLAVETGAQGDAAETALADLLERRTASIAAAAPQDIVKSLVPVGGESVRVFERRSTFVQLAYGEMNGVLALGSRPDGVVGVQKALQAGGGIVRAPRFRAVCEALGGADAAAGRLAPGVLTFVYADLRRLSAMMIELAPELATNSKDMIDTKALRRKLEAQNPRASAEAPAAHLQRIDGLFGQAVQAEVDAVRRGIEKPFRLLELFSAAGLEIAVVEGAYRVKAAALVK